jgi:hypothetical protein
MMPDGILSATDKPFATVRNCSFSVENGLNSHAYAPTASLVAYAVTGLAVITVTPAGSLSLHAVTTTMHQLSLASLFSAQLVMS